MGTNIAEQAKSALDVDKLDAVAQALAEVEVFAGGNNVAGGGKATQSSTGAGGVASRAIDGNKPERRGKRIMAARCQSAKGDAVGRAQKDNSFHLGTLGLERKPRPVRRLHEHLAEAT